MPDVVSSLQSSLETSYRFEREISRGGMATVFLAHDLKHDRHVAIKVLLPEFASTLAAERFLREIRVVARLQHPLILPLFDSGEAASALYYVMPYVNGETLRARIERERTLPVDDAVRIAREVGDALAYAHEHHILHRDIKPENIMLTGDHAVVVDFGIARAIHVATDPHLTRTGLIVGTPAYMSPEQGSGDGEIDERSDQYSLACVLYEMLAGRVPHVSARGTQGVIAERFHSNPTPVRALRADVPDRIEMALARALSTNPDRRYASVRGFIDALAPRVTPDADYPELTTPIDTPVQQAPQQLSQRAIGRRGPLALGVALIVIAGLAMVLTRAPRGPALDELGMAVLPFVHLSGAAPALLNGDHCGRLLYDALSRWRGIHLVNDMRVRDARARRGGAPTSVSDALATGRKLGAGMVVWGEVSEFNGTVQVRATLYRLAGNGAREHQALVRLSPESDVEALFATLADSLVGSLTSAEAPPPGASGTRDLGALRSYVAAHSALDRWDMVGAERGFREAMEQDTAYAQAHLWLAQLLVWQGGRPISEWRPIAARAGAHRASLNERDQQLADALLRMGARLYPDACESYRVLIARDSLDFTAWFGLGECQSRDGIVERDASSRSGWRFRASQHSAIEAYRRSLALVPSFQSTMSGVAYPRLTRLLYTEPNFLRIGSAIGVDTMRFAAYPSLVGDTLAFTPYPLDDVASRRLGTYPTTLLAAVDRNRRVLRDLSERWSRDMPRSALAFESLGNALEGTSELLATRSPSLSTSPGTPSALDAIRRARTLAIDREQLVRLGANEVRVLLKLQRFGAAAALADSLIAPWLDANGRPHLAPTQPVAQWLATLAAVTGRVRAAAAWSRIAARTSVGDRISGLSRAPLALVEAAAAALVYAASGSEGDSTRALILATDRLIASEAAPQSRETIRASLLDWPAALAYPDIGMQIPARSSAGGNTHLEIAWALARADTGAARAGLARLAELTSHERPGDVGYDAVLLESRLRLTSGDSLGATRTLAASLDALAASGQQLMTSVSETAALPRAMLLRAELAKAAGDGDTARQWARSVWQLWRQADDALMAPRERVRRLAR